MNHSWNENDGVPREVRKLKTTGTLVLFDRATLYATREVVRCVGIGGQFISFRCRFADCLDIEL